MQLYRTPEMGFLDTLKASYPVIVKAIEHKDLRASFLHQSIVKAVCELQQLMKINNHPLKDCALYPFTLKQVHFMLALERHLHHAKFPDTDPPYEILYERIQNFVLERIGINGTTWFGVWVYFRLRDGHSPG
jgi:hypothetical protein